MVKSSKILISSKQENMVSDNNCSSENKLESIKKEIEKFVEEYINDKIYFPTTSKIIHDTLWGTISFRPHEIFVIDLPLIQRLRQIKQTSLVYYVFPSCIHTRFEHTLGVVSQVQRLIDVLNKTKGPHLGPDIENDLRMAAIFHDSGQGPFSHLSEDIYRYCTDMQFLTGEEGPYTERTPHEVLSYLILSSSPIKHYFKKLQKKTSKTELDLERIANWVLGIPENNKNDLKYRAEIINGSFDSDKLDYIFRDGYFSGLPVGLDIERLWASCEASIIDDKDKKQEGRILTLSQNSATPLEQILFNKINLFSIVYHHPKVRAAECMVKGLIECIQEDNERGYSINGKMLKNATDFLWLTDDIVFAEALKRDNNDPLHQMIHDIVYRRFLVRALTISSDTIEGIAQNVGNPGYWRLRSLNEKTIDCHNEQRKLAREIWDQAGQPCSKHHIWVDLPHDPPTGEADRVFVRYPKPEEPGYSLRKLSALFPLDYWIKLYNQHKWRGHVFCPRDCQQKVYDAAIKVIEKNFEIKFKKSAGEISHVPTP